MLTAIDDALDTGVAADDDPLTRELQELALAAAGGLAGAHAASSASGSTGRWRRASRSAPGSERAWWQPLLPAGGRGRCDRGGGAA